MKWTGLLAIEVSLCCVFALPSFAQKTPPAGKPATGSEEKKEGDGNSYKDKEFNFEWQLPTTIKYWHLEVPERKGNALVVEVYHGIGEKKDFIDIKFIALSAKSTNKSDKELFESYMKDVEDSFAEISKNDVNEKDKFKGQSAFSVKFNGRNKDERKQPWDRNLFLFKKSGSYFAVIIQAEAGLLDKYKAEIDDVFKGLKIK
ncbi:MAG: hypothetical protein HYR85_16125 [Planctomycetes bacterium]|nr:hypothetical protein [Planctomycetota bacterium]MBI3846205.1 hypothetical protein [Planctomycetota bacterium]